MERRDLRVLVAGADTAASGLTDDMRGGDRALTLQTPPVSDEHQWACGGAWLGVQRRTPVQREST